MKLQLNPDIMIETNEVSIGDIHNNGDVAVLLLTMNGAYGSSRMVRCEYPTMDAAQAMLVKIVSASAPAITTVVDSLPEPRPAWWLTAPNVGAGGVLALQHNEADMELIADCGTDAARWATELGDIIRDDDTIKTKDDITDEWLALWFSSCMEAGRRDASKRNDAAHTEAIDRLRAAMGAEGKAAARAVQFLDALSADADEARKDIMSLRSIHLPVGDEPS